MRDSGKIIGFLSFIAVACAGISLFISSLISAPKTINILNKIAYYSAFFCIVLSSFLFVFSSKKMLYWIIWIIFMVLFILGGFIL